ncbi:hypothetical protein BUE76_21040 [Cnuella takakiae]|nr:hypothetical protein BUE76_21040 [Cnuella takakiae]
MGMKTQSFPARLLVFTGSAALLSALASGLGIGVPGVYRDNAFVRTAWLANDWVTLAVVLPALILSVYLSFKKSKLAQMVWTGLMAYLVYNYAFYLFGAAFNKLFLLYVLVVICGLYSLLLLVQHTCALNIPLSTYSRRYAMAYLLVIGLMLIGVETPPIFAFINTGRLPAIIPQTGHPTAIVYALDLTLVVPSCLIAVHGLWHRRYWAATVATIMLVKGAAYGLVLVAGTLLLASGGVARDPLLAFYILITLGGLAGLAAIGKAIKGAVHLATKKKAIPMS